MAANTFVNSGIGSQIVFATESAYGTAASLAPAVPVEFNSETLELKKTVVQGKGLHAGGLHLRGPRRVLTNYAVSGGINLDLPTQGLNGLLQQMFGSPNNPNAGAQGALTPDGKTGAYSAVHGPGNLKGLSLTVQKGVPSVDGTSADAFTYTGVKLTDWTISVATGAIASLALTVDGRNELSGAGTAGQAINGDAQNVYPAPALATFAAIPTNSVFHFREAALLTGTVSTDDTGVTSIASPVALGNVKSAEVKYAFKMDTSRYFLGSAGFKAEPIENDFRDVTGQFVVEWNQNATGQSGQQLYAAFAGDIPLALSLKFTGPVIGSGADNSSLEILIPSVYLEGETPKVAGPAVVTQTVPFTGLDDGTNNPIQATYYTLDAS